MTKQGGVTKNVRGVLGTKLGMTQVFDGDGKNVPVTAVAAGRCVVTAVRSADSDGDAGVQLACGGVYPRNVTTPLARGRANARATPHTSLVRPRAGCAH